MFLNKEEFPLIMKATVLCVDDETKAHEEYDEFLTPEYKLVHAYDRKEAIRNLKSRKHIDVVLADYALIGDSGVQLLLQMRDLDFEMPVLIVSSRLNDHIISLAQRAGAYGAVRKEPRYYVPALEEILQARHGE